MSLYRNSVYHSDVTMVGLAGVPRPSSGAGHKVGDPKRVLRLGVVCMQCTAAFLMHVTFFGLSS